MMPDLVLQASSPMVHCTLWTELFQMMLIASCDALNLTDICQQAAEDFHVGLDDIAKMFKTASCVYLDILQL
jgi:hypothetical protein